MKPITKRLQRLRLDRDRISQRDLAVKAAMPVMRYWEIENGYRVPNDDEIRALAKALKCTQSEIVGSPEESVAS